MPDFGSRQGEEAELCNPHEMSPTQGGSLKGTVLAEDGTHGVPDLQLPLATTAAALRGLLEHTASNTDPGGGIVTIKSGTTR